jgi:hypothetical protein
VAIAHSALMVHSESNQRDDIGWMMILMVLFSGAVIFGIVWFIRGTTRVGWARSAARTTKTAEMSPRTATASQSTSARPRSLDREDAGSVEKGTSGRAGLRHVVSPTATPPRRIKNDHREAPSIRAAAVAGALATYGMGVAGRRVVAPALGMKPPSGLGRWIGHMFQGRFKHHDIATDVPRAHQAAIGTVGHYALGVTLGAAYALLLRVPRPRPSSLGRATAYGVATTALPWFWMFPARGRGIMRFRHQHPRVPTFALCTHVAYGVGLEVGLRLADLARRRDQI